MPTSPHRSQVTPLVTPASTHADDALAAASRAVADDPASPAAHADLARVLAELGGHESAVASYERALSLRPDAAELRYNLGNVLTKLGRIEQAIASYDRAVSIDPELAEAHANCGLLLKDVGRSAEAIACLRRYVALRPDAIEASVDLAILLRGRGQVGESLDVLRRGLARRPDFGPARMELLITLRAAAMWDEAAPLLAELQRSASASDVGDWVRPFDELALPLPAARHLADAARFGARLTAGIGPLVRATVPRRDRRLRVGYVSADFRDHPLAHLMQGLFARHDRREVEVFVYSIGPNDRSPYRARIAADAEHFVDLARFDAAACAARIARDGIDVLVDLMGYTALNRFAIFAHRPAPVQATYMGFAGSLGSPAIDFNLVDRVIVPPEHADAYAERLVYLPDTYMVTDDAQPIDPTPATRAEHGLPVAGVVFACFNAVHKIEAEVFDAWMRILARVDRSVLWLLEPSAVACDQLRAHAGARGIAAERLVFAPRLPKPRHLARVALADLVLDTFYFGAHTTAVDALWAGVPVLTCPGTTFAARVGASVLTAMRLPELIAPDRAAYETLAVALGTDADARATLRARVAHERATSPLFDTTRFARHMERAFHRMYAERTTATRIVDIAAIETDARS